MIDSFSLVSPAYSGPWSWERPGLRSASPHANRRRRPQYPIIRIRARNVIYTI